MLENLQKRAHLLTAALLLFVISLPHQVFANHATGHGQPQSGGQGGEFQNPLKFNTLQQFFNALLDVVITIGFPLVVLAFIYSGFLFVKAQGNPDDLKDAKKAFLYTAVGALLVLGAFALTQLIKGTVDEITFLTKLLG